MLEVTLAVKLTVQAPFSTQSSSMGAIGIDAPLAKTHDQQPYIPGTLLKGKLRQSWRELSTASGPLFAPDENHLLGEPTGNDANGQNGPVEPRRGLLYFSDLVLSAAPKSIETTRIQMNPDLGSVKKGSYQVIETPCPSGGRLTFAGSIRYFVQDSRTALQIRDFVEKGLRWITSIGAERTAGFGRLLESTVEHTIREANGPELGEQEDLAGFDLLLEFAAPFCVAKRRISDNLFQSDSVIPGSVIKGAIASTWAMLCGRPGAPITADVDGQRPELCRNFEMVRFTQALPSIAHQPCRPVAVPLSVVRSGTSTYDVLLCSEPGLIEGHAPRFSVDWKGEDHNDVLRAFGWPSIRTQLRVRTAISEKQRRAEESMLFAYELIEPVGLVWHTRADLGRVADGERARVGAQLRSLLAQGIHGLGKTKVSANVRTVNEIKCASSARKLDDGWFAITLQAPALLCDPRRLEHGSGDKELHQAYADTWDSLSAGSLKLVRYFARQSLAGGFYLHRRFRSGESYAPWLLTDSGSVFLLHGTDEQAEKLVSQWEQQGLPLPAWAVDHYSRGAVRGDHWSNCPYIPENGYGEIAVNLDVHQQKGC